ncbi:MAG: SpoIID/LytB domain-containing protein, partial [Elusimicrobia bacterium]|nr:SpoIID/LytB domain-containing protein [Elusimicrobiota bacterium]
RTFALNNLGKFGSAGFDLSTDQRSQVYGEEGRDPRTTNAVKDTDGLVLHFKGRMLKAFFHACCGGSTTPVGAVWGDSDRAEKPVRGVKDRWCSASPHMEWKAYFAFDDILNALVRNGKMAMKLKGVGRGDEDASGRLKSIRFFTDAGTFDVRADHFRNWMGSADLKSTNITRITRRSRGYEFLGKGYGHGAGLCQWGARAMAEKGKTYKQILEHYFPGAELVKRDD